jgi:hypothetical protein
VQAQMTLGGWQLAPSLLTECAGVCWGVWVKCVVLEWIEIDDVLRTFVTRSECFTDFGGSPFFESTMLRPQNTYIQPSACMTMAGEVSFGSQYTRYNLPHDRHTLPYTFAFSFRR